MLLFILRPQNVFDLYLSETERKKLSIKFLNDSFLWNLNIFKREFYSRQMEQKVVLFVFCLKSGLRMWGSEREDARVISRNAIRAVFLFCCNDSLDFNQLNYSGEKADQTSFFSHFTHFFLCSALKLSITLQAFNV